MSVVWVGIVESLMVMMADMKIGCVVVFLLCYSAIVVITAF